MARILNRFLVFACMSMALWSACDPTPPQGEKTTEQPQKPHPDAGKPDGIEPAKPDATQGKEPQVQEKNQPDQTTAPEPNPSEMKPDVALKTLTYWKDVKTILDQKCANCHKSGGVGPFPLEDYKSIYGLRSIIKAEVKADRMPPWQAAKSCQEFSNDISLTVEEKKKVLQWIEQGAAEGDPKEYVKPPPAPPIGLKRIDLTLQMKKPHTVAKSPDEYRCFVVDWTPKTVKYVTGFQVNPGNPKIVHHVIAYIAKKDEAAQYLKKDPDGNGYRCYGTAGGPASLRWLGVWAPGVPGAEYPKGTGIKVEPDSKIIIQLHYNTSKPNAEVDQTKVDFTLEDTIEKEAILFPYTNPNWLKDKKMKIPANEKSVDHSFTFPLRFLGLINTGLAGIKVYSAMLHMHQLGKSGRLTYGNNNQCLLDLPRWDFNWQLSHHLKKPIALGLNDSLGIACNWDNSQANQPILDGKQKKSQDVYWGDGTGDEMCLGIVYITCDDANKKSIVCPDLSKYVNP